ncbi:MAG TPA: DUF4142 domain-containing protein [Sandaracinaceae bacterium]
MRIPEKDRAVGFVLFALTALIPVAAGCDDDDGDGGPDGGRAMDGGGGRDADGAIAPTPDGAALSDAEVAGVVNAIIQAELAQSMLAEDATNAEVRAYAAMMIASNTNLAEEHVEALERAGVTPVETELSVAFTQQVMNVNEDLSALTGAEREAAYVDAQVILHAEALDIIQTRLMPSVTNTRYRQFVIQLRDAEVAALQAARDLDMELGGGGGTVMPEPEPAPAP